MRPLLLDTHAVLFWWANSPKLGAEARAAIADASAALFVSAATAWEIATKFRIGKLTFAGDPAVQMPRLMDVDGFEFLPINAAHALRAGALEGGHGDPFDRVIAAQALIEGMTVVTRDPEIAAFGCKVLW